MKTIVDRTVTKTNQAYKQGWELLARAKVLASEDRKHEIIDEIRRYFNEAIKYNFNDLVAELAKYQYYYFLHNVGNRIRAEKFKEIHKKYNYLSFVESEVIMEYADISNKLNSTRSPSKELKLELHQLCETLKPYLKLDSVSINIRIYMLLIAEAHLELDYEKVVKLCTEVIYELEEKGIERTAFFYKSASLALILNRQFDDAAAHIERALLSIRKGHNTWALFAYYQVLVELHRGDYETAYFYYKKRNNTKIINRQLKEQWLILSGYFKFLSKEQQLSGLHSFKVGKFLNSIPVFEKDKSGNNISILILRMLVEGPNWILDKEESFRQYFSRYMKAKELKRAKLTMMFLIAHAKYSYHPAALQRHAGPILEKLRAIPMDSQNIDIEIIPFHRIAEIKMGQVVKV